jgi:TonB family protein
MADADKGLEPVLFRGEIAGLPPSSSGTVHTVRPAVYFNYEVHEVLAGRLDSSVVHALYVSEPPCGLPKLVMRAKVFVMCSEHIGPGMYCLNPVPASEENLIQIQEWTRQAALRRQELTLSEHEANARLTHKVEPRYSALARMARVQGVVVLRVVIDKYGKIAHAQPISGPPILAPDALDAVQHWRYRPFLLNGRPVRVETTVSLHFRL